MSVCLTEETKNAFFKYVIKTKRDDGVEHCWLWHGPHNTNNYGVFDSSIDERNAHRFSWLIHRGDIPKGMTIDHICEIRCCVNPDHMELKTQSENSKMIGMRDVIQLLYNRTNNEYDIMDTIPTTSRLQQCVKWMEERNAGLAWSTKFKDYVGDDIGKKITVDMLDTLIHNKYVLFPLISHDWDTEFISGYKKKWFYFLICDQIEYYGDVPLRDIFDYYTPELERISRYRFGLQHNISTIIRMCDDCGLISKHNIRNQIKDKLDEVNTMLDKLRNS